MNNKDLLIKEILSDFYRTVVATEEHGEIKSFLESSLSRVYEEGVKNGIDMAHVK